VITVALCKILWLYSDRKRWI